MDARRASTGAPVRQPVPAVVVRAERWGAFFLYVGLVVVHLFLGLTMSGPVIYPDEGAYLGNAHLFASGTGLLYTHSPYQPGYSLLLVPLVRLFPDPLRAYHATLILNAMLLAGAGVAVFVLSRHLGPRRPVAPRLAIAAVVASYPAFLDYSNLVISMNLFVPGFILLCLVLVVAFRRERVAPWFACGAIAGALYIVHPIGLLIIFSLILVAIVIRRRRWLQTTIAVVLGLQLTLIPGLLLIQDVVHVNRDLAKPLPLSTSAVLPGQATAPVSSGLAAGPTTTIASSHTAPPPQSRTRDVLAQFGDNRSLTRIANNLYELAGQIFYLAATTFGLWALGMAFALVASWRVIVRRSTDQVDRLALFIGIVAIATLVSSALRLYSGRNGTGEADQLIYGRYNELVLAPVLVLGLVAVQRLRPRAWWKFAAWPVGTATALAATGAMLYVGRSHAALHQVFVDVNVFALNPLLTWFGGIDVMPIVLIGIGATVCSAILVRRVGMVAMAVPVVAICVLSASFSANRLSRDSDGRTIERSVLNAVHTIAARAGPLPHCIGYDLLIERVWHLSNDQFFLPTTKFRRFNSFGEQPCSDLVITGRPDLNLTYPGARLVSPENFSPTKLWVLPGVLLDRLRAAGMVLPPSFPSALPDGAFHAAIKVVGLGPGTDLLPYGGGRDLVLAVTHTGSASPWPSRYGFTSGDGWVRVAVVWVARSNSLVPVADSSVDIPRTVFPGDTVDVRLNLIARDVNGLPLPPGQYFVRIGLVQEGFSFFSDKGQHTLDLAVSVAPPLRHSP
jgi:hypothetical protein